MSDFGPIKIQGFQHTHYPIKKLIFPLMYFQVGEYDFLPRPMTDLEITKTFLGITRYQVDSIKFPPLVTTATFLVITIRYQCLFFLEPLSFPPSAFNYPHGQNKTLTR